MGRPLYEFTLLWRASELIERDGFKRAGRGPQPSIGRSEKSGWGVVAALDHESKGDVPDLISACDTLRALLGVTKLVEWDLDHRLSTSEVVALLREAARRQWP